MELSAKQQGLNIAAAGSSKHQQRQQQLELSPFCEDGNAASFYQEKEQPFLLQQQQQQQNVLLREEQQISQRQQHQLQQHRQNIPNYYPHEQHQRQQQSNPFIVRGVSGGQSRAGQAFEASSAPTHPHFSQKDYEYHHNQHYYPPSYQHSSSYQQCQQQCHQVPQHPQQPKLHPNYYYGTTSGTSSFGFSHQQQQHYYNHNSNHESPPQQPSYHQDTNDKNENCNDDDHSKDQEENEQAADWESRPLAQSPLQRQQRNVDKETGSNCDYDDLKPRPLAPPPLHHYNNYHHHHDRSYSNSLSPDYLAVGHSSPVSTTATARRPLVAFLPPAVDMSPIVADRNGDAGDVLIQARTSTKVTPTKAGADADAASSPSKRLQTPPMAEALADWKEDNDEVEAVAANPSCDDDLNFSPLLGEEEGSSFLDNDEDEDDDGRHHPADPARSLLQKQHQEEEEVTKGPVSSSPWPSSCPPKERSHVRPRTTSINSDGGGEVKIAKPVPKNKVVPAAASAKINAAASEKPIHVCAEKNAAAAAALTTVTLDFDLGDKKNDDDHDPAASLKNEWPLTGIVNLHPRNDFLFLGNYKKSPQSLSSLQQYTGNQRFKQLCLERTAAYNALPSMKEKHNMAMAVVLEWRTQQYPPGRFLEQDDDPETATTATWHDVGNVQATAKAARWMRESAKHERKRLHHHHDSKPAFGQTTTVDANQEESQQQQPPQQRAVVVNPILARKQRLTSAVARRKALAMLAEPPELSDDEEDDDEEEEEESKGEDNDEQPETEVAKDYPAQQQEEADEKESAAQVTRTGRKVRLPLRIKGSAARAATRKPPPVATREQPSNSPSDSTTSGAAAERKEGIVAALFSPTVTTTRTGRRVRVTERAQQAALQSLQLQRKKSAAAASAHPLKQQPTSSPNATIMACTSATTTRSTGLDAVGLLDAAAANDNDEGKQTLLADVNDVVEVEENMPSAAAKLNRRGRRRSARHQQQVRKEKENDDEGQVEEQQSAPKKQRERSSKRLTLSKAGNADANAYLDSATATAVEEELKPKRGQLSCTTCIATGDELRIGDEEEEKPAKTRLGGSSLSRQKSQAPEGEEPEAAPEAAAKNPAPPHNGRSPSKRKSGKPRKYAKSKSAEVAKQDQETPQEATEDVTSQSANESSPSATAAVGKDPLAAQTIAKTETLSKAVETVKMTLASTVESTGVAPDSNEPVVSDAPDKQEPTSAKVHNDMPLDTIKEPVGIQNEMDNDDDDATTPTELASTGKECESCLVSVVEGPQTQADTKDTIWSCDPDEKDASLSKADDETGIMAKDAVVQPGAQLKIPLLALAADQPGKSLNMPGDDAIPATETMSDNARNSFPSQPELQVESSHATNDPGPLAQPNPAGNCNMVSKEPLLTKTADSRSVAFNPDEPNECAKHEKASSFLELAKNSEPHTTEQPRNLPAACIERKASRHLDVSTRESVSCGDGDEPSLLKGTENGSLLTRKEKDEPIAATDSATNELAMSNDGKEEKSCSNLPTASSSAPEEHQRVRRVGRRSLACQGNKELPGKGSDAAGTQSLHAADVKSTNTDIRPQDEDSNHETTTAASSEDQADSVDSGNPTNEDEEIAALESERHLVEIVSLQRERNAVEVVALTREHSHLSRRRQQSSALGHSLSKSSQEVCVPSDLNNNASLLKKKDGAGTVPLAKSSKKSRSSSCLEKARKTFNKKELLAVADEMKAGKRETKSRARANTKPKTSSPKTPGARRGEKEDLAKFKEYDTDIQYEQRHLSSQKKRLCSEEPPEPSKRAKTTIDASEKVAAEQGISVSSRKKRLSQEECSQLSKRAKAGPNANEKVAAGQGISESVPEEYLGSRLAKTDDATDVPRSAGTSINRCCKCHKGRSAKDCPQSRCKKCCTSSKCVTHNPVRDREKFTREILDGRHPVQQYAQVIRKAKLPKGRFHEPGFVYVGDTVVIWNIHEYNRNTKWREDAIRKSIRRNKQAARDGTKPSCQQRPRNRNLFNAWLDTKYQAYLKKGGKPTCVREKLS